MNPFTPADAWQKTERRVDRIEDAIVGIDKALQAIDSRLGHIEGRCQIHPDGIGCPRKPDRIVELEAELADEREKHRKVVERLTLRDPENLRELRKRLVGVRAFTTDLQRGTAISDACLLIDDLISVRESADHLNEETAWESSS